jgi:hypothetical protein
VRVFWKIVNTKNTIHNTQQQQYTLEYIIFANMKHKVKPKGTTAPKTQKQKQKQKQIAKEPPPVPLSPQGQSRSLGRLTQTLVWKNQRIPKLLPFQIHPSLKVLFKSWAILPFS